MRYGVACDLWSVGVLTYHVLSGRLPFAGRSPSELALHVLQGRVRFEPKTVWEGISPLAVDFVKKLLVRTVDQRLTADEALAHPWLRDVAPHAAEHGILSTLLRWAGSESCLRRTPCPSPVAGAATDWPPTKKGHQSAPKRQSLGPGGGLLLPQ